MKKLEELRPMAKEIVEQYQAGESTIKIAKKYDTHKEYIRNILVENNIERRTRKETTSAHFRNETLISKETLEIMDGWLLGDGGLGKTTGIQGSFSFTSKHEQYIDYVINILEKEGLYVRKYYCYDKTMKCGRFRAATRCTVQLGEIQRKWYPNGKKIVPRDLKLSAAAIRHWIMDDGTRKKDSLVLCTNGFTVEDCEYLVSEFDRFMNMSNFSHIIISNRINKNGIKVSYPLIYISRKNTMELFKVIGKNDVSCFDYKWVEKEMKNFLIHKMYLVDLRELKDEIIELYQSGFSTVEIGEKYDANRSSIRDLLIENNIERRSSSESKKITKNTINKGLSC